MVAISKRFLFFILLFSLLFLSACTQSDSASTQSQSAVIDFQAYSASDELIFSKSISAFTGQPLLAVMEPHVPDLEIKEFSFGAMVTALNGVTAQDNEYWALFVDCQYSDKGVSDVRVTDGMNVTWKLQSLSSSETQYPPNCNVN